MARMLFLRDINVDVQLRCLACGHGGALPRSMLERRFGPNYPVLSIAPHYRCSRCDSRDTESRPAPLERFSVDQAPEEEAQPSVDASLAALQGLLASVRGEDVRREDAQQEDVGRRAPPPPSWRDVNEEEDDPLPVFQPFTRRETPSLDRADAEEEPSWDELPRAPAAGPGRSRRALEDLVADGPADADAAPLWEPVSLADMAARLDGGASGGLAPSEPEDQPEEAGEDPPLDETLAAMRRFFAETDLDEDGADEGTTAPRTSQLDQPADVAFEDDAEDGEADELEPPVFSHRALVRSDFDDDPDDFADDTAVGNDDGLDSFEEDEPTDEEILAFAIRDPEKPVQPAQREDRAAKPAAAKPVAVKPALAKPVVAEEDEGFDKTLAALRSMIEDAATEPNAAPVRRKARPVVAPPPEDAQEDAAKDSPRTPGTGRMSRRSLPLPGHPRDRARPRSLRAANARPRSVKSKRR